MNNIQIFNNAEFGEIRTITIEGEPWFVGRDISDKLGYAKTSNMVKLIDEDDRQVISSSNLEPQVGQGKYKQSYQITIINESGLYAAIFGSKQDNAKKFKKWVTSEVLPSIRKTGTYNSMPKTPSEQIHLLAIGYDEIREKVDAVSKTVDTVKSDFEVFKEDCPLFPVELEKISMAVKRKGVECMGGKKSMAYHDRSIVQAVYHDIYGEIHRNFACKSYKEIARKNVDKVLVIVDRYNLPYSLSEKIGQANA